MKKHNLGILVFIGCVTLTPALRAEHAFGPPDVNRVGRPIDPGFAGFGCQNANNRQKATIAFDALADKITHLRGYGALGVSVGECDRFQVARLLGRSVPIFVVAPPPVCGLSVQFTDATQMQKFLRDFSKGKVLADNSGDTSFLLDSDDDARLTNKTRVALCPMFTDPVKTDGIPDCWSDPEHFDRGVYSIGIDDKVVDEKTFDRVTREVNRGSLKMINEPLRLKAVGMSYLNVRGKSRQAAEKQLYPLTKLKGVLIECSPFFRPAQP